MSFFKCSRFRL